MDCSTCYTIIAIIGIVLMMKNHRLISYYYWLLYYAFWSEFSGALSMVSCHIHKKDNVIKTYPNRKGMIAIVTGGGRGIGPFIVRELLKCGMHVIVAIRNPDACDELKNLIKDEKYPGTHECMKLDVSKMKSVKLFADDVKAKHPAVHLLVNNAGIIHAEFQLTEDNFESHLATNYMGHFYLTHLLLDNLKLSGKVKKINSRIVNVSSSAHISCGINFGDMNWKIQYYGRGAYGQSKSAQIMMTRYQNKALEMNLEPVRIYAVHPGVVDTSMVDIYRGKPHLTWFMKTFLKSPLEGAISVVYACIDEGLEGKGGLYLSNCKEGWSTMYTKDKTQQQRLHELSCKMLNIKKFGDVTC